MTTTATQYAAPARRAGGWDLASEHLGAAGPLALVAFLVAHAALGIAMVRAPGLATVHAAATLVAALVIAVAGTHVERVAYACAYIVGSEVLWRTAGAAVPWEIGKYAIAGTCMLAVVRSGRLRLPVLPVLFFALLLPSALLTIAALGPAEARSQISFYLSGPLALAASAWFFSRLRLPERFVVRTLLALAGPVAGSAAAAALSTAGSSEIVFGNASNFATSGGFGPNQVSSVLGLGVLACFLCCVLLRGAVARTLLALAGLAFATQSALTFSRSGSYMAAAGIAVALLFFARDPRSRRPALVATVVLVVAGVLVVVPRLDAFTGGAFLARFENTGTTNRDVLAWGDLAIWREHPLLGVGPGVADSVRASFLRTYRSHTEVSRLVAEHGVLGLFALVCLVGLSIRGIARAPSSRGRAVAAALVAWSWVFLLANAMRVAAPAFLLGLVCARIGWDPSVGVKLGESEDGPTPERAKGRGRLLPRPRSDRDAVSA